MASHHFKINGHHGTVRIATDGCTYEPRDGAPLERVVAEIVEELRARRRWFGWYSAQQAETARLNVYGTPDGREVVVSMVTDSAETPKGWPDYEPRGEVTEWLRFAGEKPAVACFEPMPVTNVWTSSMDGPREKSFNGLKFTQGPGYTAGISRSCPRTLRLRGEGRHALSLHEEGRLSCSCGSATHEDGCDVPPWARRAADVALRVLQSGGTFNTACDAAMGHKAREDREAKLTALVAAVPVDDGRDE